MTSPDDTDDLKRLIKIMNKDHGYGGIFNRSNAEDKTFVELDTTKEWCLSVEAEFGWEVGEPRQNMNDPPDCYVSIEGRKLGVELVQLVEQEHKERSARGETPYANSLFSDMQWSKKRLLLKLNELLKKKGDKYSLRGLSIDVLLIHAAEPWLTSGQVVAWLTKSQIEPHPNIAHAFLLLEYEPGSIKEHWPVFSLYGDLGRMR